MEMWTRVTYTQLTCVYARTLPYAQDCTFELYTRVLIEQKKLTATDYTRHTMRYAQLVVGPAGSGKVCWIFVWSGHDERAAVCSPPTVRHW
jgi:hypothetical protein